MILYEGPSMIDGKPIVAIATGDKRPSTNIKTGPMVQTWILRSDIPPVEAIKLKEDKSICGACPHRGLSCYVQVPRAPTTIFKFYKSGGYKYVDNLTDFGRRRDIRLGAYGDPAAVPFHIWEDLTKRARMHTGYTHSPHVEPRLKNLVMASADSVAEAQRYQADGWKTFRVKKASEPLRDHEMMCLNTSKNLTCQQCGMCNGQRVNVAIDVHGLAHKISKFNNWSNHESL